MADYWHKTLENEHRLFCFLLKGEESQKQRRFGVLLDFSTKNNEDLNSFFFPEVNGKIHLWLYCQILRQIRPDNILPQPVNKYDGQRNLILEPKQKLCLNVFSYFAQAKSGNYSFQQ